LRKEEHLALPIPIKACATAHKDYHLDQLEEEEGEPGHPYSSAKQLLIARW